MSKRLFLLGSGLVVITSLVITLLTASGTMTVERPPKIGEGAEIKLSITDRKGRELTDNKLPAEFRLKSGRYLVSVYVKGFGVSFSYERIWPFQKKTVSLELEEEELPGFLDIINIPFIELFPYVTADFEMLAVLDDTEEGKKITKILLTVFHRFTDPSDGELYEQEFNMSLEAARKYLRDNGVPDTIPLEVIRKP